MTKLIIKGPTDFDSRFVRNSIYLDGQKIGRIGYGETLKLEVESGDHNLYGKILWYRSKNLSFYIKENQTKTFRISRQEYQKYFILIFLVILFIYSFARINYNINLNFLLILLIFTFVYPFYTLTFGRNKYLKMTELL